MPSNEQELELFVSSQLNQPAESSLSETNVIWDAHSERWLV